MSLRKRNTEEVHADNFKDAAEIQQNTQDNHKNRIVKVGAVDREKRQFIIKMAFVLSMIILQFLIILFIYGILEEKITYWRTFCLIITAVVVLYIVNKQENPAYKLIWIILIMISPLVGGLFYLFIAGNRTSRRFRKDALSNHLDTFSYMPDDSDIQKEIHDMSRSASAQSYYISKQAGYPVYKNTSVRYFSIGEDNFVTLCQELRKAKHFIFMEYFIIKQGYLWDTVRNILAAKVKEGVDVRLIYDDFGCAMFIPSKFRNQIKALGIKAEAFNPVKPIITLRKQNNRDHRKITIIDGCVGFTGGINLADEYINRVERFGHWKDTGVMIQGEAVWNLTLMFLQTWKMLRKTDEDYAKFRPDKFKHTPFYSDGYIQPYGDTPVDDEVVGENIYLNIINKAKKYVYITTPYLIIDNEMLTALTLAAKNGIDVRIITPGIPDKKSVFMVTQSYYYQLIIAGVKIYQYTPGFIHAKTFVCDDVIATVGTVNLDFRSLYLHFECGVWMYNSGTIFEIKEDYIRTIEVSEEITKERILKTSPFKLLRQAMLRLVAPLM